MLKIALLSVAPLFLVACESTKAPVVPEMDMDAMMARATELGTPGEGHARLEPLVGQWTTTMTMWMEPGADPMISKGSSNHRWVLGGRYLQQDYTADFMGMPFAGIGTTAFNNATGKYQGTWIDNMSSHMLPPSEGTWDAGKKTVTSMRTYTDPITGQSVTSRDVVHIVSNDEHHFDMYESREGGGETQLFHIVYKRK